MEQVARAILDLRGLVLHAYHAGEPTETVKNSKGERIPTAKSAVDTFLRFHIEPLLNSFAPVNVIAVLEGANHNIRRRNLSPTYKQKRPEDEDDEITAREKDEALSIAQKVLLGLGCFLVKAPNTEADDVVALLVERLQGPKIIHTVDHDLLALIREGVGVIVRGEHLESFKGMDLNEVSPTMVTLWKSMVGDTSDKIAGVTGIGKETWAKFVEAYGYDGMQELYNCVNTSDFDQVREWAEAGNDKALMKLYNGREQWRQSFVLAKLHPEWCEMTFAGKQTKLQWGKRLPDRERVRKALEPIGLEHWVSTFDQCFPTYTLITKDNQNELSELTRAVQETGMAPFDYESFDTLQHEGFKQAKRNGKYIDVINQQVTGAGFCHGANLQHSFYISVRHRDTRNCEHNTIGEFLESLFTDADGKEFEPNLIAHNAAFEKTLSIQNFGLDFDTVLDTVVGSSYANENEEDRLKSLSKRWLNYDQPTYEQVVPKGCDMRDISGEEVLQYGCDDAFVTAHLFILFRLIMEVEGTWDFYIRNEPYFDTILVPSFIKGIPMDWDRLEEISAEDDQLYIETDKLIRDLLKENCSEINEEGFEVLWEEVESFERSKRESVNGKNKEKNKAGTFKADGSPFPIKDDSTIEAEIAALRESVRSACAYSPPVPKEITYNKAGISQVAQALSLPAIKSLEPDRLETYVSGMSKQFEAKEPSESQNHFITLLGLCMHDLGDAVKNKTTTEDVENFFAFVEQAINTEKDLWVGDELNTGSSKQMAELFLGKMGLPIRVRNIIKEGDTGVRSQFDLEGAPSTNEIAIRTWMAELENESWQYRVLDGILKLKGVRQRRSLYYRAYRLWRSPQDDRIHPQFKNCGTITRRPSGSSPNILQVSKTKDDGKMRSTFLPQNDDELIVSIDFVQQELVILAALSQDANLLSCYVGDNRRDVHSMTGTAIYNMLGKKDKLKEITYEEYVALVDKKDKKATDIRKKYAKTTNFLIVYGGSAVGLSRKTIVPYAMAEQFVEGFHRMYPNVEIYQNQVIKFAKKHGYVMTAFGNRKHCDGIFDKNSGIAASWERQAVNFTIQGLAADIGKQVSRDYHQEKIAERFLSTIYALIYDEVIGSVPKTNIFEYVEAMADIMEITLPGGVRLRTSVSIGKNWGEQVELGERPTREIVEAAIAELEEA